MLGMNQTTDAARELDRNFEYRSQRSSTICNFEMKRWLLAVILFTTVVGSIELAA